MSKIPSIEHLVPHDAPMILVDRAIEVLETSIHCQVDIGEHHVFFNPQTETIPGYVGIEFIAQSIAAWSGYHALQDNKQPPIGFLLGCRRYKAECSEFTKGMILDVHAEQVMEDNGMAVFSARLECEGETLAQCQLNVYVPSEEKLQEMNH